MQKVFDRDGTGPEGKGLFWDNLRRTLRDDSELQLAIALYISSILLQYVHVLLRTASSPCHHYAQSTYFRIFGILFCAVFIIVYDCNMCSVLLYLPHRSGERSETELPQD